jgi:hypothetical protein
MHVAEAREEIAFVTSGRVTDTTVLAGLTGTIAVYRYIVICWVTPGAVPLMGAGEDRLEFRYARVATSVSWPPGQLPLSASPFSRVRLAPQSFREMSADEDMPSE